MAPAVSVLCDGIVTFVARGVGLVAPLRMREAAPEVGGQAVHGDVACDLPPMPAEA